MFSMFPNNNHDLCPTSRERFEQVGSAVADFFWLVLGVGDFDHGKELAGSWRPRSSWWYIQRKNDRRVLLICPSHAQNTSHLDSHFRFLSVTVAIGFWGKTTWKKKGVTFSKGIPDLSAVQ